MRIFLTGFMGCGKSYVGKRLAELLGIPFFDLDQRIENGEKKSISNIFNNYGEKYFRKLENKYLTEFIKFSSHGILSTGGGTPCFQNNSNLLLDNGFVIFLETPVEILIKRLHNETDKRPLLKEKTNSELESYISNKLKERLPYYNNCHIVFEQKNENIQIAEELASLFFKFGDFSELK